MSPRYEGQQRRGAASVSVATQRQQAQTVGDRRLRLDGAGPFAATDSRSSRTRRPFSWALLANEP
jgi:hypothetical protein